MPVHRTRPPYYGSGNPQGPPDWTYSMPPPDTTGSGNYGVQPVDQWGYPINPGYVGSPTPSPTPMVPDPGAPTGITPEPTPIPGTGVPPGGYPIDVAVPTAGPSGSAGFDPYGGATVGGGVGTMGPTGNFHYYDAGNGVVYVYDSNWNYVGTTQNTQGTAPQQPPQDQQPPATSTPTSPTGRPSPVAPGTGMGIGYGGRGYPGGTGINFGNVGASPYAGAIGQGPDAVYSSTSSDPLGTGLAGLGSGGGPPPNVKYL